LKWGDVGATKKMLEKISRRDEIGDLLAEGVMRTAEKLGGEFMNMAVFVKKGNAPHIHDLRTRWGTLFTQAISNTGTQEGVDMTARSNPELGFDRPTSKPDEYLAEVQARTGPKRQFEEWPKSHQPVSHVQQKGRIDKGCRQFLRATRSGTG
jgi:aldehyde:ferredoxin oxidoreductase